MVCHWGATYALLPSSGEIERFTRIPHAVLFRFNAQARRTSLRRPIEVVRPSGSEPLSGRHGHVDVDRVETQALASPRGRARHSGPSGACRILVSPRVGIGSQAGARWHHCMVTLSMTDAAEHVLREQSRGAPMHYRRITELAVEGGLIVPGGSTPEASLVGSDH